MRSGLGAHVPGRAARHHSDRHSTSSAERLGDRRQERARVCVLTDNLERVDAAHLLQRRSVICGQDDLTTGHGRMLLEELEELPVKRKGRREIKHDDTWIAVVEKPGNVRVAIAPILDVMRDREVTLVV